MNRVWVLFVLGSACAEPETERATVVQEVNISECPTTVIEGIDVSHAQATVDWNGVKAGGKAFAYIKATQGTYNIQATFVANWTNAKAAGVLRGAYHFFDGGDDGVAQANAFLAEIGSGGGMQVGDFPPALDIECPTSSNESATGSDCEGTGGATGSGWVPTATLKQRAYDFLSTVQAATGMKPLVYSYTSWFGSVAFTDAQLADYPLFIASYAACAAVPPPWTQAPFWQYSGTGSAMGVTTAVDLDRFVGSAGDLAGYTLQPTTQPMIDAGVQQEMPDAADMGSGNPLGPGPAGCGCHGAGSPGPLAMGAALIMIVLRRRKVAR